MHRAMLDFHADRGSADVGDDNGGNADTLERRVAELEEENRRLRAKVADQARRLEEWSRVVAARELVEDQDSDIGAGKDVAVKGVAANEQADGFGPNWRPPRCRRGITNVRTDRRSGDPVIQRYKEAGSVECALVHLSQCRGSHGAESRGRPGRCVRQTGDRDGAQGGRFQASRR